MGWDFAKMFNEHFVLYDIPENHSIHAKGSFNDAGRPYSCS